MTPADLADVCAELAGALIHQTDHQYPRQEAYLKKIMPFILANLEVNSKEEVNSAVRLLLRSFSYAHQKLGDLRGRMNISCEAMPLTGFASFLIAYLRYIKRDALVISASSLATDQLASWDTGGAPSHDLSEPYVIIEEVDQVMSEYRLVMALGQALDRIDNRKQCAVLVTQSPIDSFKPVSSSSGKQSSYGRFNLSFALDVDSIISEVK